MYKLKQIPEDFFVDEVNNSLDLVDNGPYSVYLLSKERYNTQDAIKRISDTWKIPLKFFNYAGTKDRQAVTTQHITISKGPAKDLELKDLELAFLGYRKERLNLGDMTGNKFGITIRNITRPPKADFKIANYFDEQRFGRNANNHIIGKHIILGEFKEALELVDDKRKENYGNDAIKYFSDLPKQTARLYVHSYQSFLFNKMAAKLISNYKHTMVETPFGELAIPNEDIKNRKIPLIGFGTDIDDFEIEELVDEILDEEEIAVRDFVIRQIPYLSTEGEERDMIVDVKELVIHELVEDELNQGMKKCKVEFELRSGSYATMVVKHML